MVIQERNGQQVPQYIPSLASVEAPLGEFVFAMEEQVAPNRVIRESFRDRESFRGRESLRESLSNGQSFSMHDHDDHSEDVPENSFHVANGSNLGRNS